MSQEWYYSQGEQQVGPVSSSELKALASSGKLRPTDLVWKDGLEDWVPAKKVKGLFPTLTEVQWYYGRPGDQQGPVLWERLRQLAANGQITPRMKVWREGMPDWVQATEVEGLFPPPVRGEVLCVNCQTKMTVNSYQGQRVSCSACGHNFRLRQPREKVDAVLHDMTVLADVRDLTEAEIDEVRSLLSEYADRIPFHGIEDFGDEVEIHSARFVPVYRMALQTLFEGRTIAEELHPFDGQVIPPATIHAETLDPWSVNLKSHDQFSKHQHRQRLPESRTVESCEPCGAVGKVTCPKCAGAKKVTCPTCNGQTVVACHQCSGSGAVTRYRSIQVEERCSGCSGTGDSRNSFIGMLENNVIDQMKEGTGHIPNYKCRRCYGRGFNLVTKDDPYTVPCTTCQQHGKLRCGTCQASGQVDCVECHASGNVTCGTCQGKTRVVRTLCIDQQFQPAAEMFEGSREEMPLTRLVEYWNREDAPDDFSFVADCQKSRLSQEDITTPSVTAGIEFVENQLQQLLEKSLTKEQPDHRICQQRVDVLQVTTFKIGYEFDGQDYQLFLVGKAKAILTDGSPFADITREMIEDAKVEWSTGSKTKAADLLRRAWDMGKKDAGCQQVVDELNGTLSGPLKAAASAGSALASTKAVLKKGLGALGLGKLFSKPKDEEDVLE